MMTNELLNYNYGKETKSLAANRMLRFIAILFAAAFIFVMLPLISRTIDSNPSFVVHAAPPSATGTANTTVELRQSPSTSSASLGKVKKGAKLTISSEVFTSKSSYKSDTRWFAISTGKRSGYIKVKRVSNIAWAGVKASTTDALNYRCGAGTSMKKGGTLNYGTSLNVLLPAKTIGSNDIWYRVVIGNDHYYVIGSYLDFSNKTAVNTKIIPPASAAGKTGLAATVLSNPTSGGKSRIIYTFDKKNCKKRFSVTGMSINKVPQGLAYTGNEYHVLFGMAGGQNIVTYSAAGKKLRSSKFSFDMGHPNGITWDPVTKLCYIFKGNGKKPTHGIRQQISSANPKLLIPLQASHMTI